jgi:hypothetical protein
MCKMRSEFCDSMVEWRLLTVKCAALIGRSEAEAKAKLEHAMFLLKERLTPILSVSKQRNKDSKRKADADSC